MENQPGEERSTMLLMGKSPWLVVLTNHLEKYEEFVNAFRMTSHISIYEMENKTCSKPPTSFCQTCTGTMEYTGYDGDIIEIGCGWIFHLPNIAMFSPQLDGGLPSGYLT
jgi:hypothetical protein